MSLSERERKVLEELERGLYESDAKLAEKLGADPAKLASAKASSPRRIVAGGLLAVSGLALILTALLTQYVWFGVVGFLAMVFGFSLATAQFGRLNLAAKVADSKPKAPRPTLTELFEQRWDDRNSGDGRQG